MSDRMNQEDSPSVKCIFCGRPLTRDEMVRYRGAIACRECADAAKSEQESYANPAFFIVGGIGALIAGIGSFGYILARLFPLPQWILSGFGLISVGLAFIAIGNLGLYFNWDRKWGLALSALAIGGCLGGLAFVQNYVTLGLAITFEEVPAAYSISLYVFEGGLYIMLALDGALMVLTRDDHGIEILTLATAGAMLLASAIYYLLVPAFALLSIYFLTARTDTITT